MASRIPQTQLVAKIQHTLKLVGFLLLFLLPLAFPLGTFGPQSQRRRTLAAGTDRMIEQLIMQIEQENSTSAAPAEGLKNSRQSPFLACVPNIRPVSGPITSSFGPRTHPIFKSRMFHTGIDFSAPKGSQVEATGDGTVAWSGYD